MHITDFFASYTQAFNQQNVDDLAEHYNVPAIVMEGQDKQVFTDRAQIRQYVSDAIQNYQQQGIKSVELEVQHVMKLANDFIFCKIIWHFYDSHGEIKLECPISYTMQMHNNDVTHIVAIVKDKDKKIS
ncbi:nuclear transport factor 2 family protein [Neptunicella sp.]|uniref:nuclear transport factor 2 family protein n=1 Tax=Neptunicella sp. TaxID=2125986 RepID=UPI003F690CCC